MQNSSAATDDSATLAELRRLMTDRVRIEQSKNAELSAITKQIENLLGIAPSKTSRKPKNKTFSNEQFLAACQSHPRRTPS